MTKEKFNQLIQRIKKNDQTITSLNFENEEITAEDCNALAEALKTNDIITDVNLNSSGIDDNGAKDLSDALKINKSIVTLNLSYNEITEKGAKDLSDALKINKSIVTLNLSYNEIKDEGAKDLSDALKINKSIVTLNLSYNEIKDEGAKNFFLVLLNNGIIKNLDLEELCIVNAFFHIAATLDKVGTIQKLLAKKTLNSPYQKVNIEMKIEGYTPLHVAAHKGQVNAIKALIEAGADKEAKNHNGETPLHVAAHKGQVNAIKALIEAGADKEAKNNNGETPLHVAAHKGQVNAIKALIEAGADKEAKNQDDKTFLDIIVELSNIDIIEALIKQDVRNAIEIPLKILSKLDNVNLMKELIKREVTTVDGETPLHILARLGNEFRVFSLIEAGADKEAKNNNGQTPLLVAAAYDHVNVIDALTDKGAYTEAKNSVGETSLHVAAANGYIDVIKELIKKGANKEAKEDTCSETPLHVAAHEGQVNAIKALIDAGADQEAKNQDNKTFLDIIVANIDIIKLSNIDIIEELIKQDIRNAPEIPFKILSKLDDVNVMKALIKKGVTTVDGQATLHILARLGKKDAIKALIEAGANVEFQNNYGETPLHIAAKFNQVDVMNELINKGANVNAIDYQKKTVIQVIFEQGNLNAFEMLFRTGFRSANGDTPLHMAAANNHVNAIKAFIQAGANVEFQNNYGETPLHIAAKFNQVDAMNELINKGANVNAIDYHKKTVIQAIFEQGNVNAFEMLFRTGFRSANGDTPLHMAAANNHLNAIKAFIQAGADKEAKNNNGETPLHVAAHKGQVNAIKALIEAGADKEAKNNNGGTPLHVAAHEGNVNAIKALIEAGADIAVKNNNGDTPLHVAAANGKVNAIELLINQGSDKEAKNYQNYTPLHIAAKSNKLEAIKKAIDLGCDINSKTAIADSPLSLACNAAIPSSIKDLDPIIYLISKGASPVLRVNIFLDNSDSIIFRLFQRFIDNVKNNFDKSHNNFIANFYKHYGTKVTGTLVKKLQKLITEPKLNNFLTALKQSEVEEKQNIANELLKKFGLTPSKTTDAESVLTEGKASSSLSDQSILGKRKSSEGSKNDGSERSDTNSFSEELTVDSSSKQSKTSTVMDIDFGDRKHFVGNSYYEKNNGFLNKIFPNIPLLSLKITVESQYLIEDINLEGAASKSAIGSDFSLSSYTQVADLSLSIVKLIYEPSLSNLDVLFRPIIYGANMLINENSNFVSLSVADIAGKIYQGHYKQAGMEALTSVGFMTMDLTLNSFGISIFPFYATYQGAKIVYNFYEFSKYYSSAEGEFNANIAWSDLAKNLSYTEEAKDYFAEALKIAKKNPEIFEQYSNKIKIIEGMHEFNLVWEYGEIIGMDWTVNTFPDT